MVAELIKEVDKLENYIKNNMMKNAKMILSISIIEFNQAKEMHNETIMSILHLQISIELLIKNYVSNVYGFESILTDKYKKIKRNNMQQYFIEIQKNNIKTLGFNELKSFLEEKQDSFGYVIKEGKTPFLWFEYDYLEGLFDKFQLLRNNFVHLGIELSSDDKRWLETDFFTIIILFISMILREIDNYTEISSCEIQYKTKLYETDVFDTPIDILKKHISVKSLKALLNNKCFEDNIIGIAEDVGNNYICKKCGKQALVLDVEESEGISKCFYCGEFFSAGYTNCNICESDNTVTYDDLNIKINRNVMPGYCYGCNTQLKVYKCPQCGCKYSYSTEHPIKDFHFECCINNFADRKCLDNHRNIC